MSFIQQSFVRRSIVIPPTSDSLLIFGTGSDFQNRRRLIASRVPNGEEPAIGGRNVPHKALQDNDLRDSSLLPACRDTSMIPSGRNCKNFQTRPVPNRKSEEPRTNSESYLYLLGAFLFALATLGTKYHAPFRSTQRCCCTSSLAVASDSMRTVTSAVAASCF